MSAAGIQTWVARGRLYRLHRGVYSLGRPDIGTNGRWIAAVLACGRGAVLSHRSAAAHLGIRPTARAAIDVSVPGRAGRTRKGIEVHSGASLHTRDVTEVARIPCTTVPRTLLDLAAVVDRQGLEKAINEAEVLGVFDLRAVNETLARAGRRRGAAALRSTLTSLDPMQAHTRSDLEAAFLSLCGRSGFPLPEVNAWLTVEGQRIQADLLWRQQRLIVETDGYATHSTRRAFERDHRRDLILLRAHFRTVRLTWRQVIRESREVAASLAPLLAA